MQDIFATRSVVASRNFYQVVISQQRGDPTSQKGSCVNRNRVLMTNYFEESQARHCPQRNHLVKTTNTILISIENTTKNQLLLSNYRVSGPESDTFQQAGFHYNLGGLWEAPLKLGGSGRDRKQSAQPRVAREREEPGRETSPGFLPRHCLSR